LPGTGFVQQFRREHARKRQATPYQTSMQYVARLFEPAFHLVHRPTQVPGCLVATLPLQATEHQRRPVFFCQARQLGVESFLRFAQR
jgi:hypothetical protein